MKSLKHSPTAFWLTGLLAAGASLTCLVLLLTQSGCINPPQGTVLIDIDGDGSPDALAFDLDGDGKPDHDANGMPIIVEGSEGYKAAEAADAVLPWVLGTIGGVFGIPVLIGVGAVWKGAKFGRIFMNTVMTVQAARKALKDSGSIKALELVDAELSKQSKVTQEAVDAAKAKAGVPSVTN